MACKKEYGLLPDIKDDQDTDKHPDKLTTKESDAVGDESIEDLKTKVKLIWKGKCNKSFVLII